MTTKYSIQELISGCHKEQPRFQRALVNQYSSLLYVICLRYLRDEGYAKDALQESLVRIFQNLDKYIHEKGSFDTWIKTISIRVCLSKLSKKKLLTVGLEDVHQMETDAHNTTKLQENHDADILLEMIGTLPEAYRAVFNLVAIDGYSHKEVAEMLNINVISSRTRLNRAKKILRTKVNALNTSESWVNTI